MYAGGRTTSLSTGEIEDKLSESEEWRELLNDRL